MSRTPARHLGLTLIELILGLVVVGLLAGGSIGLLSDVITSTSYWPRQVSATQAATEVMESIAEGSVTTIAGAPASTFKGLRFAKRTSATTPSLVLADTNEFQVTVPGSCEPATASCLIRLRLTSGAVWRSYDQLPGPGQSFSTEEMIPYYAADGLSTSGAGPSGQLFRYFDAAGTELTVPVSAPNLANIRRVEIAATVQTGSGSVMQGDGRATVLSSVAIRFP